MKTKGRPKLKYYTFKVYIYGIGYDSKDAWEDALSGLMKDHQPAPKPIRTEVIE